MDYNGAAAIVYAEETGRRLYRGMGKMAMRASLLTEKTDGIDIDVFSDALRPLKPHLVLVCTDNGTPCAVISNLGDNVALRTAAHPGFLLRRRRHSD